MGTLFRTSTQRHNLSQFLTTKNLSQKHKYVIVNTKSFVIPNSNMQWLINNQIKCKQDWSHKPFCSNINPQHCQRNWMFTEWLRLRKDPYFRSLRIFKVKIFSGHCRNQGNFVVHVIRFDEVVRLSQNRLYLSLRMLWLQLHQATLKRKHYRVRY